MSPVLSPTDPIAALRALRSPWLSLWERAQGDPFQHPDWILAWWDVFAPGPPVVAAVREGERLMALAPLYRDPASGFVLPMGVGPSDRTDVLVDSGAPEAAARLAAAIAASVGDGDVLWPDVPPGGRLLALAPQPGWTPPGVDVGLLMPLAPLPVAFAASATLGDACGEPLPGMANIAAAQSGAVPFSSLKSPPFDGSLRVAVIQFGQSSTGLDETDQAVLARVAEIQRENGGTIRIVSHAAGDAAPAARQDNFEVSRRRALAIAQQLRRLGVPADRMVAEAASDEEPIYQTSTARGLAANRRADVFIDF